MTVTLTASAAGIVSYTPTADVTLSAVNIPLSTAVSFDPSLAATTLSTPTSTGVFESAVILFSNVSGMNLLPVKIPVPSGRSVFVAFKAAGTAQLIFE
jgi:ethanolamine transporter EutH